MRWTIAALMAGAILVSGCQDNEARRQIEELKAENAKLKDKPDAFTQLMAMRAADGGSDGTDRKINTLSEDLRAGIEALKREFSATNKRVDDMDDRMRKVASLDATITALKATIDSLDSRVKSSSPEEMLKLQKELFQKDAALLQEKAAREAADGRITQLQGDLKAALDAAQEVRDQIAGMDKGDISKHPAYVKAQKDLQNERTRNEHLQSDIKNMDERCQRLEAELKSSGKSTAIDNPKIDPKAYDFTGTIIEYKTAGRPGTLGNIMVSIGSGQVPPEGAILNVLNARAEHICTAKVMTRYNIGDDPTKAIEALGCSVSDENLKRAPVEGDTVVWIKPTDGKPAEVNTPKPDKKDGNAGGE